MTVVFTALLTLGSPDADFFERKIRPVLIEHCYKCHSAEAKRLKGGLRLDHRDGLLRGGDTGPAIVPGKPEESLLIRALRYEDDLEMPPKGKLPEPVIADFVIWVKKGAPDPRGKEAVPSTGKRPARTTGWAFVPPAASAPPDVRDSSWPRGTIDRFILALLEETGLRPAHDADRRTLVRRLYFALIGLPPTREEIASFLADASPGALEGLVDRLLDSPRFGERWGRHWLDLARYSDSTGGGRTKALENAWRYRDYVVASFNEDKPFDRFVREQIAGDLIEAEDDEARRRNLIATGFLVLGPHNYENQDKDLLRMDVVDEQIDTTGRVFLGMTLGCARCHDHKFDPIPSKDYYALAGIFRSTKTLTPGNVSGFVERELPVSGELKARLDEHRREVAALRKRLTEVAAQIPAEDVKAVASTMKEKVAEPDAERIEKIKAEHKELTARLKKLQATGPKPPMAISVQDEAEPSDWHVHIRGEIRNLGPKVPRGFLRAAWGRSSKPPAIREGESGRRELADWIASAGHPLTARVIVNRVWHWLFGTGLVRTVDNFGSMGEAPSHPELLDALTVEFVREGWSIKRLIRAIVLSRVYGLDSGPPPGAAAADPENRLLSHAPRLRLEAGAMRDAMLFVSGELELRAGGPSIDISEGKMAGSKVEYGYQFSTRRRSIYVPIFRNSLLEILDVFDFADPNLVVGRRTNTTRATQALYLLNSPFVIDRSARAAARLLAERDVSDGERVDVAYERILGRLPTRRERELALAFISRGEADGRAPAEAEEGEAGSRASSTVAREERWTGLVQTLFSCVDFRFLR